MVILAGVVALMGALLSLDAQGWQWAANFLMAASFALLYVFSRARIRRLMLVGIVVGTFGECLFSLVLKMYEYRLANIPLYVPPGHSILLVSVLAFCADHRVKRGSRYLIPLFSLVGLAYASAWLVDRHDVFGFLCTLGFAAVVAAYKKGRLFLLTMFLMVAALELLGTGLGCWAWPASFLKLPHSVASGNPPSGIALFYLLFDYGCLKVYLRARPRVRSRFLAFRTRVTI